MNSRERWFLATALFFGIFGFALGIRSCVHDDTPTGRTIVFADRYGHNKLKLDYESVEDLLILRRHAGLPKAQLEAIYEISRNTVAVDFIDVHDRNGSYDIGPSLAALLDGGYVKKELGILVLTERGKAVVDDTQDVPKE